MVTSSSSSSSPSSSYRLLRMLNNQRENIADVMLSISLTFNCMCSSYRAYIHNNHALAAAMMFVYIPSMFVCLPKPPRESSPKKIFLKYTISFLTSSILFVFVCGFAPLSTVGLFAIVGMFGCLGFSCLYLFMEDKPPASEEEDDEEASVSSPSARKKRKKQV